eukprot:12437539-Ditylum_brightwellii.AAC.2
MTLPQASSWVDYGWKFKIIFKTSVGRHVAAALHNAVYHFLSLMSPASMLSVSQNEIVRQIMKSD